MRRVGVDDPVRSIMFHSIVFIIYFFAYVKSHSSELIQVEGSISGNSPITGGFTRPLAMLARDYGFNMYRWAMIFAAIRN